MIVRLAMPEDKDAVVGLAQMQVEETLPHLDFQREAAEETFEQSIKFADPTFFVCEQNREVIGYLMGLLEGYAFTSGIFVVQEVLYVRPDKRGTRAAVKLLKEFVRWGEILDAREMIFGVSNGYNDERTTRFLEKVTGAQRVGTYLKRVR